MALALHRRSSRAVTTASTGSCTWSWSAARPLVARTSKPRRERWAAPLLDWSCVSRPGCWARYHVCDQRLLEVNAEGQDKGPVFIVVQVRAITLLLLASGQWSSASMTPQITAAAEEKRLPPNKSRVFWGLRESVRSANLDDHDRAIFSPKGSVRTEETSLPMHALPRSLDGAPGPPRTDSPRRRRSAATLRAVRNWPAR
jgi:hypothetical protein